MDDRVSSPSKIKYHAISRHICVVRFVLLFQHFSNHINFILKQTVTNAFLDQLGRSKETCSERRFCVSTFELCQDSLQSVMNNVRDST